MCRPGVLMDDKVVVSSLHQMEALNRSYLMHTNRSPSKLIYNDEATQKLDGSFTRDTKWNGAHDF
jgi:hypothetical protein